MLRFWFLFTFVSSSSIMLWNLTDGGLSATLVMYCFCRLRMRSSMLSLAVSYSIRERRSTDLVSESIVKRVFVDFCFLFAGVSLLDIRKSTMPRCRDFSVRLGTSAALYRGLVSLFIRSIVFWVEALSSPLFSSCVLSSSMTGTIS